jgi:hypothetical protein
MKPGLASTGSGRLRLRQLSFMYGKPGGAETIGCEAGPGAMEGTAGLLKCPHGRERLAQTGDVRSRPCRGRMAVMM